MKNFKLINVSKSDISSYNFTIEVFNIKGKFCLFDFRFKLSVFQQLERNIESRIVMLFFDRCLFSFALTTFNVGFTFSFFRMY